MSILRGKCHAVVNPYQDLRLVALGISVIRSEYGNESRHPWPTEAKLAEEICHDQETVFDMVSSWTILKDKLLAKHGNGGRAGRGERGAEPSHISTRVSNSSSKN